MGDQGRLYVNDDVVPAYKKVIHYADLILPNQFEAEYVLFRGHWVGHDLTSIQSSLRNQDYLSQHPRRSHHCYPQNILHSPYHHHFGTTLQILIIINIITQQLNRHRLHHSLRWHTPSLPRRRPHPRLLLQRHRRHVRRPDSLPTPRSRVRRRPRPPHHQVVGIPR